MSDGVNFTLLPTWDEMDFSRNCTLYGNFLASFLMPNPWDPTEYLGGSYYLSVLLFLYSVPDNYYPSSYTTEEIQELYETITRWYMHNINHHLNPVTQIFETSDEFSEKVIWEPINNCPAEYCKALGYTGNADLTGIGVSDPEAMTCWAKADSRMTVGICVLLRRSRTRDDIFDCLYGMADSEMEEDQETGSEWTTTSLGIARSFQEG
jgi:hypothetical protein